MTRETKMGLLIGLAVIVVFAVLLSQNSHLPPAGDGLELATDDTKDILTRIALVPDSVDVGDRSREYPITEGANPRESSAPQADDPPADLTRLTGDLPRPEALEPPSDSSDGPGASAPGGIILTDLPGAPDQRPPVVKVNRVAPPLEKPSQDPQPTPARAPAQRPQSPKPKKVLPTRKVAPPPVYVVGKGDTLGKIAEKHYGTSRHGVLEYLVNMNKGSIKNKDFVLAGQKLRIPDLPPELFEKVKGLNVVKINNATPLVDIDGLVKDRLASPPRRAPQSIAPVQIGKPSKKETQDVAKPYRWHVIKPKETYSSIARKYLGSSKHWREIKNLNKDINPNRMIPGTKIKLPRVGPPVSRQLTSRQA